VIQVVEYLPSKPQYNSSPHKKVKEASLVAYVCNSSTQEAKAEDGELDASLGYVVSSR
jgi:hypothetical protein